NITKKHFEKHGINKSSIDVYQVVNFIFNSIVLTSLLYRNKSSHININFYKKSLYQFVSNLGLN
ncbi:MAG: hypothetical protein VX089_00140, partial [Pseudomonadota bacterium]|nr:hypothetical protein [Pseudomonadota bacterium]